MTEKREMKVLVKLTNEEDFFAVLYLEPDERLQDLLNDSRKFIPMLKHMQRRGTYDKDVYVLLVIHKDSIQSVEER